MALFLQGDFGTLELEDSTLVIALDDCGHEGRQAENGSCFGFGGCGFVVSDYHRLIEAPWNYMCEKYFPEVRRPVHAVDHLRNPSPTQIGALTHFFTRFQFFRLAAVASVNTTLVGDVGLVQAMIAATLNSVARVAAQATFTRVFVLVESSERIDRDVIGQMQGRRLKSSSGRIDIPLEVGLIPKSAAMPAMEVADVIAHTAGSQIRHRNARPQAAPRRDYVDIFESVDPRLVAFAEVGEIVATKA